MVCKRLPPCQLILLAMDTVWCKPHQRPSCEEHAPCSESKAAPPWSSLGTGVLQVLPVVLWGGDRGALRALPPLLSTRVSSYGALTACVPPPPAPRPGTCYLSILQSSQKPGAVTWSYGHPSPVWGGGRAHLPNTPKLASCMKQVCGVITLSVA